MIGIFSNSIPGHETLSPEAIMDAHNDSGSRG